MLAEKIKGDIQNSSWIRAMFEEGEKLRQVYGADKVYDFSLGNPDYEPPQQVQEQLRRLVLDETPGLHRYTPNAGIPAVRESIAAFTARETGLAMDASHIIMTCGAAGGLNVVLKAVLNPGDEVMIFTPYFVEYRFYVENHGGKVVSIPPCEDFTPNLEILEKSIGTSCRAIILNSPNNPTGIVYSEQLLQELAGLLERKEKEIGHPILVISDEPYVKLAYDGIKVPAPLKYFPNCVAVNSFSKSLALPGERIGYIAVSPHTDQVSSLIEGMVFANRTLGFVNSPALFQKLVASCLDQVPDVEEYQVRRDLIYNYLIGLGFSCEKPQGAFYLFPKSPIADDVHFVRQAIKYNLLFVPGTGFGAPGYFRIAYCVSRQTIEGSFPAFKELAAEYF